MINNSSKAYRTVLVYILSIAGFLLSVFAVMHLIHIKDARKLCYAIETDDNEAVSQLLQEGAYPNGATHSVLHIPVSILMDADYATTPLVVACKKGNVEMVRLLLEAGADANKSVIFGFSPIGAVYASPEGTQKRFELIPLLLSYGAKPGKTGHRRDIDHGAFLEAMNIISDEATIGQSIALISMMTEDPAYLVNDSGTPLLAETRNEEVAAWLIEMGADVNAENEYGNTPLIYAVMRADTEMVEFLLANGADKSIRNNSGKTAYDFAISIGDTYIINILKTVDGSLSSE